jgi:hypothetical protein
MAWITTNSVAVRLFHIRVDSGVSVQTWVAEIGNVQQQARALHVRCVLWDSTSHEWLVPELF